MPAGDGLVQPSPEGPAQREGEAGAGDQPGGVLPGEDGEPGGLGDGQLDGCDAGRGRLAAWAATRGGKPVPLPHEWRHQSLPPPRTPYFPRPLEECKIIRHKAYALARQSPEEAITELELLDYDFYLFTERATGQDSVLYRTADGYRLAQVRPRPGGLGPVHTAVTVSEHPAPRLTLAAATTRLEALGQPSCSSSKARPAAAT